MVTLLLALAGTSLASTPGFNTPQPVRYELVYRLSAIVCPRIARTNTPRTFEGIMGTSNDVLQGRTYLTGNETLLMIDNCMMFERGRSYR